MALFKNKEEKQQARSDKEQAYLKRQGIEDMEPETLAALSHNDSTKFLSGLVNVSSMFTTDSFKQSTTQNLVSLMGQNWISMKQLDTLQKQQKKQIEQNDKIISLLEKIAEK